MLVLRLLAPGEFVAAIHKVLAVDSAYPIQTGLSHCWCLGRNALHGP